MLCVPWVTPLNPLSDCAAAKVPASFAFCGCVMYIDSMFAGWQSILSWLGVLVALPLIVTDHWCDKTFARLPKVMWTSRDARYSLAEDV